IYNAGLASLTDCAISGNRAGAGGSGARGGCPGAPCTSEGGAGGPGGGIFNSGVLVLKRTSVTENSAAQSGQWGRWRGGGGAGGGICNQGATSMEFCTLVSNKAGNGAASPWFDYFADPGGSGGALYNAASFSALS